MALNAWDYKLNSCCVLEDSKGNFTLLATVRDSGYGRVWEGPDILPAQTLQLAVDCQVAVCEPPLGAFYD